MTVLDNLRHPQHPGWQVNECQLKRALGVITNKWPDEGLPARALANTYIYVLPRNTGGKRTHRAIAVCAYCDKHVPAGRLRQHQKACPGWTAQKEMES